MDKEQMLSRTVDHNIDNISEGAKQAIVLCALSYRNGGNWGMMRKAAESQYSEKIALLKQESNNIKAESLSNGCLVLCKESFLTDNINKLVPNAINASYKQMKDERIKEDREKFIKFMEKVIDGKVKSVKNIGGGRELTIGIYSVNKVNTINLNGIEYPAYKVTAPEVISWVAKQFPNRGYFKTVTPNGHQVFEKAEKILSNQAMMKGVYKGLEISNTGTGVFMTIRLR